MRLLSVTFLSILALSIFACTGEPSEQTPSLDDPTSGLAADTGRVKEYVAPTVAPEWYESLHGDELYREAKRREADLPDELIHLDTNEAYARAHQRIELMKVYGTLAFGADNHVPEMTSAEVDFERLWVMQSADKDTHATGLWELVDMFAGRTGFEPYGKQFSMMTNANWLARGFDVSKPYGGAQHFDKEHKCFSAGDPNKPSDFTGRGEIMSTGELIRKALPQSGALRTQWTRRMAEMGSVYECIDEGVPHMDAYTAYDMYVELGETEAAKQMAFVVIEDETCLYTQGYSCGSSPGDPPETYQWQPAQFDKLLGWYHKAGFQTNVVICVRLKKSAVAASAEEAQAWKGALAVYEYCGDVDNIARMKVLVVATAIAK